jgi:hypothetical protein
MYAIKHKILNLLMWFKFTCSYNNIICRGSLECVTSLGALRLLV